MTLATRCPTCGTVFRVVQDQLRVSQGWVRCGRCSEAFNALQSMVEVPTALAPEPGPSAGSDAFAATDFGPTAVMEWPETQETQPASVPPPATPATPSALSPTPPPPPPAPAGQATTARALPLPDDDSAYVLDDPPTASSSSGSLLDLPLGLNLIASDGAVTPATLPSMASEKTEPFYGVVDDPSAPVDVLNPDPPDAAHADEPLFVLARATEPPSSGTAMVPDELAGLESERPDRAPSFLVQAERAERWRRPGVRLALALLALVGVAGLVGQVTHAFRDRIVAGVPALRPALQQACAALGCTIGEFRQIESLSVESSGLVRAEGAPVYRLSVTLRNRAAVEVAAPALDLALTDAQGKPIARRVLQMSDLYLPLRTLKAGSELPIQVQLGIGERPVSGYTVEIFYP